MSRVFEETTNSYKFLFFLALLELARDSNFCDRLILDLRSLAVRMLALAWYPAVVFRLSLGAQDQVAEGLRELGIDGDGQRFSFNSQGRSQLIQVISDRLKNDAIVRYVPFRLIRVFFARELQGVRDNKINQLITELAREKFEAQKPLYRFDSSITSLELHPEWVAYLRKNYPIVHSWAAWCWLQYMQKRNPSAPAVSSKIFPSLSRESLTRQTELWKRVADCEGIRCLYTGKLLGKFSLDHFVPWTFVAHDLLWNLVPVSREANSAKGNRLPAVKYLPEFAEIQTAALRVWKKELAPREWERASAPYLTDLRLGSAAELKCERRIKKALEDTIHPLLDLAASLGFEPNWIYENP